MKFTEIQWANSTINPVGGCDGCELWPSNSVVKKRILAALVAASDQKKNLENPGAASRKNPRRTLKEKGDDHE